MSAPQNIELFDTHAHIHFSDYELDADEVWEQSVAAGVTRMVAVGCSLQDSRLAVEFAAKHENVLAAAGIHPHGAEGFLSAPDSIEQLSSFIEENSDKLAAIGECGLDYFYENSNRSSQKELFELHLQLAEKHNLPVIFHVRDAFDDFWPIYDRYNIRSGVVHSFTGTPADAAQVIKRELYVGLNGIMTFTKNMEQLEAAKSFPLEKIVVETDAPFLTPKPFRGKICKPEHVRLTAEFLAELRGEPFERFALQTTENAQRLFSVKETGKNT